MHLVNLYTGTSICAEGKADVERLSASTMHLLPIS